MKKKLERSIVIAAISALSILPSFANGTDLTLNGTLDDILSIQLERPSDNFVISKDDTDPVGTSIVANETINLGAVNPLGLDLTNNLPVSRALVPASDTINGTTGTVKSLVIDNVGALYNPSGPLPTTGNNGALYYIDQPVQVRALRTGALPTSVDFNCTGTTNVSGFLRATQASNLSTSDNISASIRQNNSAAAPSVFNAALPHNTPLKLDMGMIVKYGSVGPTLTTVIQIMGT